MFDRRHWIPPGALIFAQLSHGLSWVLLAWIALVPGIAGITLPALAWVHLVALGWLTMAALAILIHVIPGFTDAVWRTPRVQRALLFFFGFGVLWFVGAFLGAPGMLGRAATLVAIVIIAYVALAFATLAPVFRTGDRTDRAIARAFIITFTVLVLVALAGVALAWMLSGAMLAPWVARLPAAHANLALFGWLSLLVYGVSARTMAPIAGVRTRFVWNHIAVGSLTLLGVPLLAIGNATGVAALTWTGAALTGIAAAFYLFDMADVLRRATVTRHISQAFAWAALAWLFVALVVGLGALANRLSPEAFGFVMLIGWIGQMVNAHVYHIGVRLIATIYRGEDDETRPQELVDARLSWSSFVLMQGAIALVLLGVVFGYATAAALGALCGFAGWATMLVNLIHARRAAMCAPALITL